MKSISIEGGTPLSGEITLSGNKNAVLPMIAASLLTDKEIVLNNVPDILDLRTMLVAANELGVESVFDKGRLTLRASKIKATQISHSLCRKIRTSILFAAPLLTRCGKASIWPPGGDVIGRRRLDGHLYGLSSFGAKIRCDSAPFEFTLDGRFKGKDLFLDEASVTATEHIMLAAVLAEGRTILRNAAAEPHVRSLAELLNKMGAKISGMETNTLTIDGVESLNGTEHTIEGDHIEAATFIALAAATGGRIVIHGTLPRHYWMTRRVFERIGVSFELNSNNITMEAGQQLKITPDCGNAVPVISDGPWPQFPSDMMSCALVAATQAEGTVLFFEKMFESRIYFVDRLIAMGANAIVCDPHRAVISGPAKLRAIEMSSPDIRAGMAMLIAAHCASGKSIIHNTDVIARGYENIESKLLSLGGKITIIS